jgi:hypothetical protein
VIRTRPRPWWSSLKGYPEHAASERQDDEADYEDLEEDPYCE